MGLSNVIGPVNGQSTDQASARDGRSGSGLPGDGGCGFLGLLKQVEGFEVVRGGDKGTVEFAVM